MAHLNGGGILSDKQGSENMDNVMRGVKQMSIDEDGFDPDEMEDIAIPNDNMMKEEESFNTEDLPNSLIIANVDDSVFQNIQSKAHFEAVFKECDHLAEFHYLKSFRRARVVFCSSLLAAQVKIQLHEAEICGKRIKLFFAMPLTTNVSTSSHLEPPPLEKQFLISPPASPPVGWAPVHEAQPVINYDLIRAISNMKPGEAHELHPQSANQPGIVVHVCADPEGFCTRPTLQQTKCPQRHL